MSSRVDQYQAKAAECEQKAKEAREPKVKRDFAELARQWCLLAEQADKVERNKILSAKVKRPIGNNEPGESLGRFELDQTKWHPTGSRSERPSSIGPSIVERRVRAGAYKVTRLLPHPENGEPEYRIRNLNEGQERDVKESELKSPRKDKH